MLKEYSFEKTAIQTFADNVPLALRTEDMQVFYGSNHAMHDASLSFPKNQITALIGASGSGKSTYLRSLNRMNDGIATVTGKIWYHDVDINEPDVNIYEIRRHIGMVFQRPNPFSKSIRENIIYALRAEGIKDKQVLAERVERSLRGAALWDEVKDNLDKSALALSGGQQQRLCIARSIAMEPDVLLLDEPCSALDPISTVKVEETLAELRKKYTIIIVTHNMQQAARISSQCAFFHLGHVMEYTPTATMFSNPQIPVTQDYISGSFG
ncbi:ABC-type phosphate transport system, ATPase component [Levilactobacillus namurensis DSM 19117]|uniref:ABC-type phosphate transport system, ATPase component n=1 Tax=Levilactobacillus namurensis DSM 19117 TaxID=1423773 RepID=A0A0R1JQ36_9LACO|nr:phosphate ABC transporter ATP-binding protein PstB [Levilactobacillus namurensis]KRK73541.1 ABC-type phosphate transport system, ATPase component [Levilactobacillus namurensis DSM 19117]GEO75190.1 phosphate import ATP-binding protein PstB 1 [Levilactobacillus namurensis]HJE44098.1 phosphate ABC transporter ATP-binding protein PstB [Levilactobacillus namurensis]